MKKVLKMKRKMMIGGLSAMMLLGGTAIAAPMQMAWAAESTVASTQAAAQAGVTDLVNQRIQRVVEDAAYVSWKEPVDVKGSLAHGKNLLEATGLSEDELLGRLYYITSKDIEAGIANGSLTTDQAEAQKKDASKLLKTAILTKGFTPKSPEWFVNDLEQTLVLKAASVSGLDVGDVFSSLSSGVSLATAVGAPADALVADILQDVNTQIDTALGRGELTKEKAESAKQQTKTFLESAVLRSDFTVPAAAEDSASSAQEASVSASGIVNNRLGSIYSDTAALTGLSSVDLRAAVLAGSSLADAAGMDESVLSAQLDEQLGQDINEALDAGYITADEASQAQAEGLKQLRTIVSQKGYVSDRERADYSYVIYNRMQSVKDDVVSISNNDPDEARAAINSGTSVLEATGLTFDELLSSVQGLVENDIADLQSAGLITAQTAAELKGEAATKIRIALSEA